MADEKINWTYAYDGLSSRKKSRRRRPDRQNAADPAAMARAVRLSRGLLKTGLGLSVLVAAGDLVQAVAGGLGSHPARRIVVGVALLLLSVIVYVTRERLVPWLHDAPWLILPFAAIQLSLAAFDGLPGSPYYAYCLTSVGVAVIIGGPRLVLACALLLDAEYALFVFAIGSHSGHLTVGGLDTAVGDLSAPLWAAVVLGGFGLFHRWFLRRLVKRLACATSDATRLAASPLPDCRWCGYESPPWTDLRPSERRAAENLALLGPTSEIGAKGWSKSTVNNEVRAAMAKTGARTRIQLAALTGHPFWPESQR